MTRISLSERIIPPLFVGADDRFRRPSRRDYLIEAFSKTRNIHSWGNDYSYLGFGVEDGFFAGAIGRRREETHYDGPENSFNASTINFWERSNIYLNLAPDQQVLAIEENPAVGSAWSLARALVTHINRTSQDAGFKADLFKITREGEFWRTVNEFDGPITEIQFKYVVPNVLFSGGDDTRKALKDIKQRLNGRELDLTVKNPDGLNLDDEQLRDSVEYTSKGGGEAKAKSGKKVVYQEGQHPVVEKLDDSVKDVSVGEGKLKNFLSKIVKR